MDGQLKQRMVGAAVLMALGIIFIPVLLDGSGQSYYSSDIPEMPPPPPPPEAPPLNQAPITLQGSQPLPIVVNPNPGEPPPGKTETGDAIATQAATVAKGDWVVQMGSFSQRRNAEKLTEILLAGGYEAFIETVRQGDAVSHRVRVGPQVSRAEADDIRKRLAKQYDREGVVMHHRGSVLN